MTLSTILPFLDGFKAYGPDHLKRDLVAGLTVALVLIPQSMAYAQLAGLPPYYGLYAAFLPPVAAALFGSSRQLATGPVAVVSLLTAVALGPMAAGGSDRYVALAILLALLMGIFQLALGALRLGMLVNFLSHPVVNGFTNAAAIIIATSQIPKMFGVAVEKGAHHHETVMGAIQAAMVYLHRPALLLGGLAFGIMFTLRRLAPKVPNVLVAVVVTTLISWLSGFELSARFDVSDIASPRARVLIADFNATLAGLEPLIREPARLRRMGGEAEAAGDRISAVNLLRDADIAAIRVDERQRHVRHIRDRIRALLFVGVRRTDGRTKLYPREAAPAGAATDGRTWRIRVQGQRLDPASVPMTAGGDVVGRVPRGLPPFAFPEFEAGAVAHLLPFAVIISLLGFMEAVSIAKSMAAKTGQRIDPNQELIGQGIGNICGALSGSYPTAGSFSRSAVNLQAGACSGMSGVFTGLAVVVALFVLTPLLYHLPQSVLAAIIMMAVVGLINFRGVVHAWRAQWYDGVISVITFVCTLGFAPHLEYGILVGVVLSVGLFLYKSMRPTVVDLSLGVDRSLHDAVSYGLEQCRFIDVVRFDGPLFFANASYLEDQIRKRRSSKAQLKHIIIVANGINDMDVSGEEALSLTVDRVRSAGIGISMSGVNESVVRVMQRTYLMAKIGEENLYPNLNAAIAAVHADTHRGGLEKECPLTTVVVSHRSERA